MHVVLALAHKWLYTICRRNVVILCLQRQAAELCIHLPADVPEEKALLISICRSLHPLLTAMDKIRRTVVGLTTGLKVSV